MHLGIDLGGTKIEAAVLDEIGSFRFRERLQTPQGDYPATLTQIGRLVRQAEVTLCEPCTAVGVGHPGSASPIDGRIRNANSTCLNGQRLQEDLSTMLKRPVRLANDADCLVLSEALDGAAQGADSVFGVILGTGVGGGWVIRGQLLQGPNGLAGEWGHSPLPVHCREELPGPDCYCGKRGCIEAWLSGPALVADYQLQSGDMACTDVRMLVAAAAGGNTTAQHCLDQHTRRLARALAVVINTSDPAAIVLGGGVAQRPGLVAGLKAELPNHVFLPANTPLRTNMVLPRFGDSSGVRGAARLFV